MIYKEPDGDIAERGARLVPILQAVRMSERYPVRPTDGAIAQLGERIVRNDEVVGSIPTSSTNLLNNLAAFAVPVCMVEKVFIVPRLYQASYQPRARFS